ncbi:unnamed protein product, partial [Linum tenue]
MFISCAILLLSLLPAPAESTNNQFNDRGGSAAESSSSDAVYIVYMGAANPVNFAAKETVLNSLLQSGGRRETDVLRSYSHGLSGFAARLSPAEAQSIAAQPGVVSVFPGSNLKLHTTRSRDFLQELQSESDAVPPPSSCRSKKQPDSSNIVIGIFDSGIWPESESFRLQGTNHSFPRGWNGTCMTGRNFNTTACNGYVTGTARGGSESARIAVYKVCQHGDCPDWLLLGAFDDAIADGVHVISLSLGSDNSGDFLRDPQALGAFHAVEHGITVVCAGGNSGPRPSTISNDAPWIITVDRAFESNILLGGGQVVKGEWIGVDGLISRSPIYPLIDGRSAKKGNVSFAAARSCEPNSLSKEKTEGKIVICDVKDSGLEPEYEDQLREVLLKGGLGVI